MKKNNNTKVILIALLIIFGITSLTVFAQDTKDEFKSKVNQLKGKVEKVTVKVDGKDVVFEGEDAEKAARSIKAFSKTPHVMFLSEGEEEWSAEDCGNVMMYKFDKDIDWKSKDGKEKKVEVRIDDGKKKVTVTTNENGEEKTKVYEGEEAEKFLDEQKKEGKFNVYIDGDEKGVKENVIFFRENDMDDEGSCCCHHKMKMRKPMHDKGVKKIIIERTEKEEKDKD